MWDGFPFNHGERWAVGLNNKLIWKRPGYRFESAFDHTELIERYQNIGIRLVDCISTSMVISGSISLDRKCQRSKNRPLSRWSIDGMNT